MGVSFYTSLNTDIKIHSSNEKDALHKRNALHIAVVCFKYINSQKKRNLTESSHLKRILFGVIAKREYI